MRTSKPVSTICYNSKDFLELKLKELMRNKRIQDYFYIKHNAEADEKKDHIHLFINPNRLLDTMDLQDFLTEDDVKNPTKPLRPLPFKFCRNLDEWILYCEHYPAYLASKMEERTFIYGYEDFCYADENSFFDAYLHAHKGSEWAHRYSILKQLDNPKITGLDLIMNGSIPLNMATQVAAIDRMKMQREIDKKHESQGILKRNNLTHTPKD